jgi:ADP-heptose:LPS heptosyltransferase
MSNHRLGEPLPRRVAILRALQMGDLLCAVPAMRALRSALPEAEIVLIGLPWAREFVDRYTTYLDGFREFPGYPGLPEQSLRLDRFSSFLDQVHRDRFDLVLQLHGDGTLTNPLAVLLGARSTAGFYKPGQYCPDAHRFLPYPEHGLEIDRLLSLMELLGVPLQGNELEFPLRAEDHRALHDLPGAREFLMKPYVCMHVGASTSARRWPVENFIRAAAELSARGYSIVLTGTAVEADLTRTVARGNPSHALDLAGLTNLGTLGALLSGARLLVCNDTGVSHVAAALRVPSVVISTGTNPERWAPRDADRHRVLCRETGVPVREVISQAIETLDRAPNALLQDPSQVLPLRPRVGSRVGCSIGEAALS